MWPHISDDFELKVKQYQDVNLMWSFVSLHVFVRRRETLVFFLHHHVSFGAPPPPAAGREELR